VLRRNFFHSSKGVNYDARHNSQGDAIPVENEVRFSSIAPSKFEGDGQGGMKIYLFARKRSLLDENGKRRGRNHDGEI